MPRLHHHPDLKVLRRDLWNRPTTAEAALWKLLRRQQLGGLRFRRQHSVGRYVLDFYCPSARLAIELDGSVHDDPARAAYDAERQRFLQEQGIRVLRLENRAVLKQSDLVVAAIGECAGLTPLPPAPYPRGGEWEK